MIKNGSTYRFVVDAIGTVHEIVDVNTGAVAEQISYDEFGQVLADTNPGFQPFAFAGGLYDQDTKLVHFGARDYDPEIGRWTSKDPALFQGGSANLYNYSLSDPVNLIDANGRFATIAIGGAIGFVTGAIVSYFNHQDPLKGAIVGAITGAAIGSGAGLFATGAIEAGLSAGSIAASASVGAGIFGFAGSVASQELVTGNVNLSDAAYASIMGMGTAAAGVALGGGAAVDLGLGLATQPVDIGYGAYQCHQ